MDAVITVAGDQDHPADLGTLDLTEAGEVEGEVVDSDNRPVAGARVARDAVPAYLPLGPLPRGVVVTDREGRFKLGGLPEGKVAVEAYVADLGRGRSDGVTVRAGLTTDRVKVTLVGGPPAGREPSGGGSLAVTLGERAGVVSVVLVPSPSEAEAAGIEPGDQIVAVDGHDVHSIEAARSLLNGPLSEDVVVALRREEDAEDRTLLRVRRERVQR